MARPLEHIATRIIRQMQRQGFKIFWDYQKSLRADFEPNDLSFYSFDQELEFRKAVEARKNECRRATKRLVKLGLIKQEQCEICGSDAHCHHVDLEYIDYWNIKWLCPYHHTQEHARLRRILPREPGLPPRTTGEFTLAGIFSGSEAFWEIIDSWGAEKEGQVALQEPESLQQADAGIHAQA